MTFKTSKHQLKPYMNRLFIFLVLLTLSV